MSDQTPQDQDLAPQGEPRTSNAMDRFLRFLLPVLALLMVALIVMAISVAKHENTFSNPLAGIGDLLPHKTKVVEVEVQPARPWAEVYSHECFDGYPGVFLVTLGNDGDAYATIKVNGKAYRVSPNSQKKIIATVLEGRPAHVVARSGRRVVLDRTYRC